MRQLTDRLEDAIYAGVLGKTIGVYLGRPVEGWSYKRIRDTFDEVKSYVHNQVGSKIVEVDDDLSGTFTFINVLKEIDASECTSKDIGDFWLNEIIEYKTIFWWGGYYRSTEHTAYLNLINGIDAPKSGAIETNGKVCAEQIGSQIFIDGWGLIHLGHPESAKKNAIAAAQVSHDGIAVKMAAFIAILEAIVYEEKDIKEALKKACVILDETDVTNYVDEMIDVCSKNTSWREVRDYIETTHSYERYKGNCPIVTNFLAILMSLLMNDNDFLNAISIATSCGWDTDCNAGNVGCIEGVRLGLEGIYKYDYLKNEFNEKVYVVNAESSEVNQDVTSITCNLLNIRNKIYHDCKEYDKKYSFDFYGSTNGFYSEDSCCFGSYMEVKQKGLYVELIENGSIKRDIYYYDKNQESSGYELVQSPPIFPGQWLETKLILNEKIHGKFFVEIVNGEEKIERIKSESLLFENEVTTRWRIPSNKGYPIISVGLEFENKAQEIIIVDYFTYYGNPNVKYETTFEMSPNYLTGHVAPTWYKAFTTTTNESAVDHLSTFCVSSTKENGLLYIGNREWKDYSCISTLIPVRSKSSGIIFRMQGLRKYYAFILEENQAKIIKVLNKKTEVLVAKEFIFDEYDEILTCVQVVGNLINVSYNNQELCCHDDDLESGGCGFVVSVGTMMVKGLEIVGE